MNLRRRLSTLAVTLSASLAIASARAEPAAPPSAAQRHRAAAVFDAAVARFNHAEFAEAARGFFEADELSPSPTAITNAIAAARRASDHLLVARAAERAIARGDALVEAREALAEAAIRLSRLELTCDAHPCELTLDGAPAASAAYVLPGTHLLVARGPADASVEERVLAVAGATYRLTLHPVAAPPPPSPSSSLSPLPPVARPPEPSRGLPPSVFFTGVGAGVLLVGLTTWSGVDALAAKRALPPAPTQGEEDTVRARARRTDFLLGGAALVAVATTIVGVRFTAFHGAAVTAGVAPVAGAGAPAFVVGGHFQ